MAEGDRITAGDASAGLKRGPQFALNTE